MKLLPILESAKGIINSRNGEGEAFDPFFLAMADQKLGHVSQDRACFDRAARWWGEH